MKFSGILLLLANAVPLFGVLFWHWDVVLVLALFWIENLIIGCFNLVRMGWASVLQRDSSGLFLICFFTVHYGVFCAAHGLLLAQLLGQQVTVLETLGVDANGLLELFLRGAAVLVHFLNTLAPAIWLGVSALLLSRLSSFIENFVLHADIFTIKLNKMMMQPYRQILVMHVGLVVGAFLLQLLGSPVWLLALLVLLKTTVDYQQYRRRNDQQLVGQVKNF